MRMRNPMRWSKATTRMISDGACHESSKYLFRFVKSHALVVLVDFLLVTGLRVLLFFVINCRRRRTKERRGTWTRSPPQVFVFFFLRVLLFLLILLLFVLTS